MIPPLVLGVQPHHTVLDLCAAPGSKTSQVRNSTYIVFRTAPNGPAGGGPARHGARPAAHRAGGRQRQRQLPLLHADTPGIVDWPSYTYIAPCTVLCCTGEEAAVSLYPDYQPRRLHHAELSGTSCSVWRLPIRLCVPRQILPKLCSSLCGGLGSGDLPTQYILLYFDVFKQK